MEQAGRGQQNPPHLKLFFSATHREWRLSLQNDTGAPYGMEHNATANPDDGYLLQDTVDAIVKLAKAMAIDREAVTQLTTTISRLTTELATVNEKIVVALQGKRASRGSCGECDKVSRGQVSRAQTAAKNGAVAPALAELAGGADLDTPIHYCWTYRPRCKHNSIKYPKPMAGYIYTATKRNMQVRAEAPQ